MDRGAAPHRAPARAAPHRMSFQRFSRPSGFALYLLGLAGLGAALVLALGFTWGVGVDWDGVAYIGVARALLAGDGFTGPYDLPFTHFGPLYPLLLAAPGLLQVAPYAAAGLLNAVLFGLTVWITGQWLRRRLASRFLAAWGALALTLAVPAARVAAHVWSETLFILWIMCALICTDRFFDTRRASFLAAAGIFTALACLTRYIGVALMLSVALGLWVQPGTQWRIRVRRVTLYALLAAAPLGLWMGRNVLLVGAPAGRRDRANIDSATVADSMLEILAQWIVPASAPGNAQAIASAGIVLALLVLVCAVGIAYARVLRRSAAWSDWSVFCVCGTFVATYLVCLGSVLIWGVNVLEIDDRYLVPAYAPLLCAGLCLADKGWRYARRRYGYLAIGTALAVLLWIPYQATLFAQAVRLTHTEGSGPYTNPGWAQSEVVQYLRQRPLSGHTLHTNRVMPLYFHTDGLATYRFLPTEREALPTALTRAADGDYVVWFYAMPLDAYGVPALRRMPALKPVAELADGILLRVDSTYVNEYESQTQAAYEAILASGPPAIRSHFDVRVTDNAITFLRDDCSAEDIKPRFLLQAIPVERPRLPPASRDLGFENLDFAFDRFGAWFGSACFATVPLPDYALGSLRAGQWIPGAGRELWTGEVLLWEGRPITRDDFRTLRPDARADAPVARAVFDVYLRERMAVLAKAPCTHADTEPKFFLHVIPERSSALSPSRRELGFDSYGFRFASHGARLDDQCVVVTPSWPPYAIRRLRVGQWLPAEERVVWQVEIPMD